MNQAWFKYLLQMSVAVTVFLELIAIRLHQYTVSDMILENTTKEVRVAFCVWVFLHLVTQYWGSYK